jgi:pseudomonalisin
MKKHKQISRLATVLLSFAGTLILGALALSSMAQTDRTWASTETKAHPTQGMKFLGKASDNETVEIVVALKLRNLDVLKGRVAARNALKSPEGPAAMGPDELAANHLPMATAVSQVVSYLKDAGFTNIEVANNRLLVSATGSVAALRGAFNVEIEHVSKNGRTGIANTTDAQIPTELSNIVLAVLGLQTIDQAHTLTVQPLNPTEFPVAYSASSLPAATNTAVGVITEGSMTPVIADLHTFESVNGLPTINPTVINVGGTSGDTTNTDEWDLDSQDIQAMAGGQVQAMYFYTATSLSDAALAATFNRAVSDNLAPVVNVSIGNCESTANSDGTMATDDQEFLLAALQGQTFVVASGDHGSKECGAGANGTFGTVAGEQYPAVSQYVVAVGGTTLSTSGGGTYVSETGWTYSGGGPSLYEVQPPWQMGIVPGTFRGVPDVAFDADPNSGAMIIVGGVSYGPVGGTSLAAPLFTGSWARLQSAHANALGFPTPWIYKYGSVPPASAFHDITSGNNGDYSAGVGWDYVTGFGSLNVSAVSAVVQDIIYPQAPAHVTANANVDCPEIFVSWPASVDATSYKLFQEQANLPWVSGGGGLVWSGTALGADVSVTPHLNYLWKVEACNANGCSLLSASTASAIMPRMCP